MRKAFPCVWNIGHVRVISSEVTIQRVDLASDLVIRDVLRVVVIHYVNHDRDSGKTAGSAERRVLAQCRFKRGTDFRASRAALWKLLKEPIMNFHRRAHAVIRNIVIFCSHRLVMWVY